MTPDLLPTIAIVVTLSGWGIWLALRWYERSERRNHEAAQSRMDSALLANVESGYNLYDQDADELVEAINAAQFSRRRLTPEEWVEAAQRVRVHVKRAGKGRG